MFHCAPYRLMLGSQSKFDALALEPSNISTSTRTSMPERFYTQGIHIKTTVGHSPAWLKCKLMVAEVQRGRYLEEDCSIQCVTRLPSAYHFSNILVLQWITYLMVAFHFSKRWLTLFEFHREGRNQSCSSLVFQAASKATGRQNTVIYLLS